MGQLSAVREGARLDTHQMKKANEKENYLDDEERELIKNFILKIKKELSLEG